MYASRPLLITLLGALEALAGLAFIVIGVLMCLGTTIDVAEEIDIAAGVAGIALICVGIIPLVIGYGLLKGWRIMWYLGVIFGILGLLVGLLSINIIAIIIELIILYYLYRPGVKQFFGI